MKIRTIGVLALAFLLAFSSCSGALPGNTETAEPEPGSETRESAAETTWDPPYINVPDPLTRAELDAFPKATAEMTEDELRDLCANFFILQGTFQWTPTDDFSYIYEDGSQSFSRNVLYGGMPYSHASSSLYAMLELYDETTGVLDVSKYKNNFGLLYGNDCADALFWAWARVCNKIDFAGTRYMTAPHGCLKVGDYDYDATAPDMKLAEETVTACARNGREVMFASYALMKRADAITSVNATDIGIGGHTRMILENHPEKGADGKIDGAQSYVLCIEQWMRQTRRDGVTITSGMETRFTYEELFTTGYLPLTAAEFVGKDPVEKAEAWLEIPEGGDWTEGVCRSNYRVAIVKISIADAEGNEAYGTSLFGSDGEIYGITLSRVVKKNTYRRNFVAGQTYTLTITATVGTGETFTVYTQKIAG